MNSAIIPFGSIPVRNVVRPKRKSRDLLKDPLKEKKKDVYFLFIKTVKEE